MANEIQFQQKYETINRFLTGEYALIHVDTKAEGLDIPSHLLAGDTVTLKISTLFRGAMEVTKTEIIAELLFSGSYYRCIVPLEAIWGVTDDKGANYIWPESVPSKVLEDMFGNLPDTNDTKKRKAAPNQERQDTPAPLPSRGHLRRVK